MTGNLVSVVGSKNSGKTLTMELLISGLTRKGYRVAAIKHVPEHGFTIDTPGKDTWRYASAGAVTIVSVASGEIATIEKLDTRNFPLSNILQRCGRVDLVVLEGLKRLVSRDPDVPKIVAVKSAHEASESAKKFTPLIAFTGIKPIEIPDVNIPYTNLLKNRNEIASIVEKYVRRRRKTNPKD